MDARITPGPIRGQTSAPPSKSYTHRAVLAAGLGSGGTIRNPLRSADTEATATAVRAFGGTVAWEDDRVEISGFGGEPSVPVDVIDCANSGTTLRLSTAVAGLVDGVTVLTGDASLRDRPQGPLINALNQLGATAESTPGTGEAPLLVRGPISGGRVAIPGDVSSQFVTALLMAGACTETGIRISLETPLKSAPYVRITQAVLKEFGVTTQRTDSGYVVEGDQQYVAPETYAVPADFSSLSYLLAAGAIAAPEGLTITGVTPSRQGDQAIIEIIEEMGATVDWDRETATLSVRAGSLTGITVDVGDTPDLLPTLAVLGAVADGTTRITNCEHVRLKETDRVSAMASELASMGAVVEESAAELLLHGDESELTGGVVDGHGDHRVVMALSVAALGAAEEVTIRNAEHVSVSFPNFFEVLRSLGASVDRLE